MIRLSHNHRSDYDKQIQFATARINCYSKAALKRCHPDGAYRVVGEIRLSEKQAQKSRTNGKKTASDKRQIGEVHVWETVFPVMPHSRLSVLYKAQGYISVGEGEYLLVRQSRVPFLIPFLSMIGGIIVCIILLLLLLNRERTPDPSGTEHPLPPVDSDVETLDETGGGGEEGTDPPETDPVETDPTESGQGGDSSDPQGAGTKPSDGGGSVSMIYTTLAEYTQGAEAVKIYFKNPSKSNHDVVLELYALSAQNERVLMAKTGRIPAGTGIEEMHLEDNIPDLAPGSYKGLYRVLFYNPTTGERSTVNSEITDVVIKVK